MNRKTKILLVVALLVAALTACGGGGSDTASEKTFSDARFPFTFTYPDELETSDDFGPAKTAGGNSNGESKRTSLVLDLDNNGLVITSYPPLRMTVTSTNLPQVLPELDGVVSELAGKPVGGRAVEVGGFPGALYEGIDLQDPAEARSLLLFLFDDKMEYSINCQSTPDRREQVTAACDQALATLRRR